MVNLEWYSTLGLGNTTEESVRAEFINTLVKTNRSPSFLVDSVKVFKNVRDHGSALGKLNEVLSSSDRVDTLASLLLRDPSIRPTIPMLIAWRLSQKGKGKHQGVALTKEPSGASKVTTLDFSERSTLTREDAMIIARFLEDTRVLSELANAGIRDLFPYYAGVEVGIDTNARKNRSGKFLEELLKPLTKNLAEKHGWEWHWQEKFQALESQGISVPPGLRDRKFDAAFVRNDRKISMEMSYYNQLGSKPQETVDSYIRRVEESRNAGWEFVWVTDGPCWRTNPPQLKKGFREMDAVLNLDFCNRGVLESVLSQQ